MLGREPIRVTLMAVIAALLAASASAQAPPAAADAGSMSAVQVLLAMKKVYGNCRSYRDSGDVRRSSETDGGHFGSEVPFATAFVRGGAFRFQFTDEGLGESASEYVVWSDGKDVRSWWDAQPGVRRVASLQEALDAASGISADSSLRVPGMLLPHVVGGGAPLLDPERIGDDTDRGVPCLRIRGKGRRTPYTQTSGSITVTVQEDTLTLWIDRATFLLRRVEELQVMDTYRTRSTTTYEPQMNVEIPAAELAFGKGGGA
jgi:hypothetical protein